MFRPVWGRSTYRWVLVVPVIAWVLCPGCVQRTPTHRVDVYLSSWPHSGVNRLVESTACRTICSPLTVTWNPSSLKCVETVRSATRFDLALPYCHSQTPYGRVIPTYADYFREFGPFTACGGSTHSELEHSASIHSQIVARFSATRFDLALPHF